jgi:hypothetical protein
MRLSKTLTFAIAMTATAAIAAAPASGAPPKRTKAHAAAAKRAGEKAIPDFATMLGLFDKLFPAQPDPDPARLALARTSVQAMWPDGAYGKMMTGLAGGMFDRVMQLKKSDLAGLDPKLAKTDASASEDLSLHDQAAAKDPYFDQRMAAIRDAVGEEVGKVSAIIDPRMRDGLARSMARRFDEHQLADINGFFATPSGRALAGQYMQLWVDPDTMRSLFGTLPEMMKLMPDMMAKLAAANDKFPKPEKAAAKPTKH